GEGTQQRVDVDDGGLEASRYHVARNRHRCGRAGDGHASDSPPLDRLTTIRRGVGVSGVPRLRIAEWPRRILVRQTVDSPLAARNIQRVAWLIQGASTAESAEVVHFLNPLRRR